MYEVWRAINNLALGKSPAPMGTLFYIIKRFQKLPIPKLCNYLNTLVEGETMREESLLAYIALIPRGEGPANYRPISVKYKDFCQNKSQKN